MHAWLSQIDISWDIGLSSISMSVDGSEEARGWKRDGGGDSTFQLVNVFRDALEALCEGCRDVTGRGNEDTFWVPVDIGPL
jgi:hypothetical protein